MERTQLQIEWEKYYRLVTMLENAERPSTERLKEESAKLRCYLAEIDKLTQDFPDPFKRPRLRFWDMDLTISEEGVRTRQRHIVEAVLVDEIREEYRIAKRWGGGLDRIKANLKKSYEDGLLNLSVSPPAGQGEVKDKETSSPQTTAPWDWKWFIDKIFELIKLFNSLIGLWQV